MLGDGQMSGHVTYHASRITYHASRITHRVFCISYFVFRIVYSGGAVMLLLGTLVACGPGAASDPQIRAEDVWARPAVAMEMGGMPADEPAESDTEPTPGGPAMGGTGAVFMTLVNEGREPDRLVAAQADVAETVEIHQTTMEGDVMRMQPVSFIEVPARGEVELKPGGYHVMLIGLRRDLAVGDRFPVTLTFEKSPALTVEAKVREP
jgi:copper(I)-binding protein